MQELTPEEEARSRLVWWNDKIVVLTREGFDEFAKAYRQSAQGFLEMLETNKGMAESMRRVAEAVELERILDCIEKEKVNLN